MGFLLMRAYGLMSGPSQSHTALLPMMYGKADYRRILEPSVSTGKKYYYEINSYYNIKYKYSGSKSISNTNTFIYKHIF